MPEETLESRFGPLDRFVKFIIENRHFTLLIIAVTIAFGALSFFSMPVAQDPDTDMPIIDVHLTLPGASPRDFQHSVLKPLEREFRSLPDLKKVTSDVTYNRGKIDLEFQFGTDLNAQRDEITSRITRIIAQLPAGLEYHLELARFSDFLSPFLLSITSDSAPTAKMQQWARVLEERLRAVNGLKKVEALTPDKNIVVALDAAAMTHLRLTPQQAADAIRADNAQPPGGRVDLVGQSFHLLGPEQRYHSMADIAATRILTAQGDSVALRDIARIEPQALGADYHARDNGVAAIFVKASADPKANMLTLKQRVDVVLETLRQELPAGINAGWTFDQSRDVERTLTGLLGNIAQGVAILFGVLLLAVGLRSTLIISSVVPLALLASLMLLSFTPYGIQQVTIAGFLIALGLIVDNSIVITENAYLLNTYHGYDVKHAAIRGASSAISPLFSSTLTTMLAFSPVFLLDTYASIYMRSLSVTIWLCLVSSLVMAVTFASLLLSTMGTRGRLLGIPNPPSFLNALIPFRDRIYRRIVLKLTALRWVIIPFFVGALMVTVNHMGTLPVEIFPHPGDANMTINITMPPGATDGDRDALARRVEERLRANDEVRRFSVMVGSSYPFVSLGLNEFGDVVFLLETTHNDKPGLVALQMRLSRELDDLRRYARFNFATSDPASAGRKKSNLTIELTGADHPALLRYGRAIDDLIHQTADARLIQNGALPSRRTLRLMHNQQKALASGVDKPRIDQLAAMLTYGWEVDRYRDDTGRGFPILLKWAIPEQAPWSVLEGITLSNAQGHGVPASDVAALRFDPGQTDIRHVNFQPQVEIDLWLNPGEDAATVGARILERVQKEAPPPAGVNIALGGALKDSQESFQGLGMQTGLVIALIFAVFVLQFRSFLQPIVIFSAIPFSIIGSIWALSWSGQSISFIAALGAASLMGIVVNDSILMVEEGNRIRRENPHWGVDQVAAEAACKRFMPVLLTSVTTIAGMIPLALSTSMFKPLAVIIIGGLISSTVLLLFLVPALYTLFSRFRAVPNDAAPSQDSADADPA
ncbi:efflux RND transporter permease subunit [Magnetofaba australis]|uniref:Putative acriflavin resistance protein n=1 Tax=Magnetofaba australis IT-1 TaxID=1434232 RepID=A0A1Y2K509_9PROT|nr:efflux RND transporter permease subunit [Magnetofaba australis]OSM04063.1 putative acriflavin resistance protein [Magnetofaba australis IT-1]